MKQKVNPLIVALLVIVFIPLGVCITASIFYATWNYLLPLAFHSLPHASFWQCVIVAFALGILKLFLGGGSKD